MLACFTWNISFDFNISSALTWELSLTKEKKNLIALLNEKNMLHFLYTSFLHQRFHPLIFFYKWLLVKRPNVWDLSTSSITEEKKRTAGFSVICIDKEKVGTFVLYKVKREPQINCFFEVSMSDQKHKKMYIISNLFILPNGAEHHAVLCVQVTAQ